MAIEIHYGARVRHKRLLWWIVGAAVSLLLAGGGIAAAVRSHMPGGNSAAPGTSGSTPSAGAEPSPSPSPGADITGPLDLLLLGVDTRVSIPDWQPHTDAIMLLHVDADLHSAYLYSLPRDLRVTMPAFPKAGFRGGTYKITEAMSRGSRVPGSTRANVAQGYELLTRTVSAYTGIKTFQAGAILNFGGLERLVNELGGIDMTIDELVKSHHRKPDGSMRPLKPGGGDYTGPQAVYQPGRRHLVGWQAIDYARQRYGLAHGDYDRQRHQRQMVKAILAKALGQGLGNDPAKLRRVIEALGSALVYVGGRTPLEYGYALRDLTPARVTLVGLPGDSIISGGGYIGERLTPEGRGFFAAVVGGRAGDYLAAHPKLVNRS